MLRTKRLAIPVAFSVLFVSGCPTPSTMDATTTDTNNSNVARCDVPDSSTSCGHCYTASGDTIIDCNNCLGTDGQPHVLC